MQVVDCSNLRYVKHDFAINCIDDNIYHSPFWRVLESLRILAHMKHCVSSLL